MPTDPRQPAVTTRRGMARVDDAVRFVAGLTRDGVVNVTPLPGFATGAAADTVVWPVEVTGGEDSQTGLYPGVIPLAVPDPYPAGAPGPAAVWVDAGTLVWVQPFAGQTLAAGDTGLARLVGVRTAADEAGHPSTRAVYAMGAPAASARTCGPGCGWAAGLREEDCLTTEVVSAAGRCDCGTAGAGPVLGYDGGYAGWTSGTYLTVCTADYRLVFDLAADDAAPRLALVTTTGGSGGETTYRGTLDCCGEDYAVFAFGQAAVCTGDTPADPACTSPDDARTPPSDNVLRVKVAWTRCPNDDWGGPGWYCVGDPDCGEGGTTACVYYDCDPGPAVYLCSGPHDAEADCLAACGGWYCVGDPDCEEGTDKACVRSETPLDPEDPTTCGGPYPSLADCMAVCDPTVTTPLTCCPEGSGDYEIPSVLHWTVTGTTGGCGGLDRTSGTLTYRTLATGSSPELGASAAWVDDSPGPSAGAGTPYYLAAYVFNGCFYLGVLTNTADTSSFTAGTCVCNVSSFTPVTCTPLEFHAAITASGIGGILGCASAGGISFVVTE